MALKNKQLSYILKNKNRLSAEKIASDLNVNPDEVKKIIDASKVKAPFYFYLILLFIPILFLVLLEAGLRVFDYGYDLTMWVNPIDGKYIINPDVARRYFSASNTIPSTIEDIFDVEKKQNSFRVFVLGESTSAGYPYMPMGSFSRYIRKRLELAYPSLTIEVINISLSATNSYTYRDFVPDVIEQKPDLVLIYAGHNEYYGALGVGSLESVSNSPGLVNLYLYMNRFKTTQIVKGIIEWFAGLFSSESNIPRTGTLMSRMAKEKYIEFGSENYRNGIAQFENNFSDVLSMFKDAGVPTIVSTQACNLKDQFPFISVDSKKYPRADSIFINANREYKNGNYKKADSLFTLAKELDGLRFRAPEEINSLIKKLSKDYSTAVIDVDSLFRAFSPNGITGNNLMTDHLHPTLEGFQLIGKLFYEKMEEKGFLPKNIKPEIESSRQDSLTVQKFVFSKFDSVTAVYRIRLLKNDWPFIDPKFKRTYDEVCQPKDYTDSMSVNFLQNKLSWGIAIENTANRYFSHKDVGKFLEHMRALIYQYPIIREYYNKLEEISIRFLKKQDYTTATKILNLEYELRPNSFCTKWLGQIALNSGDTKKAIKYLEEAVSYNAEDLQALYNLAGAYAINKDYQKSMDAVTLLMKMDPFYSGAENLYKQLTVILSKNN
ncbi:MAG: hypothetical protein AB1521_00675 [Bacteroidota bacterium]